MVETQLLRRGIRDQGVLQAFLEVPRDRFVPPERVAEAYADRALPIGYGQTISQPYVVALTVQELAPKAHHVILDVGAGSGYQTAILARLVRHVWAVERLESLAQRAGRTLAALNITNVTILTQDGSGGLPAEAPFDGIVSGAAGPDVPPCWLDQLIDGGRIVIPVGGEEMQTLISLKKDGPHIRRRAICDVRFVKLIGREGWPE